MPPDFDLSHTIGTLVEFIFNNEEDKFTQLIHATPAALLIQYRPYFMLISAKKQRKGILNTLAQLDNNANVIKTALSTTAQLCAQEWDISPLITLLENPLISSYAGFDNNYLLRSMSEKQHTNIILELLKCRTVTHHVTCDANYAFRINAANGNLDVVNKLLGFYAVNEQLSILNNEALKSAALNGHAYIVKKLLQHQWVTAQLARDAINIPALLNQLDQKQHKTCEHLLLTALCQIKELNLNYELEQILFQFICRQDLFNSRYNITPKLSTYLLQNPSASKHFKKDLISLITKQFIFINYPELLGLSYRTPSKIEREYKLLKILQTLCMNKTLKFIPCSMRNLIHNERINVAHLSDQLPHLFQHAIKQNTVNKQLVLQHQKK